MIRPRGAGSDSSSGKLIELVVYNLSSTFGGGAISLVLYLPAFLPNDFPLRGHDAT